MKYELNQHVFVYDPFGYQVVECIVRDINGGLYRIESVEYKNIPTLWYGIDLYETKEQCLKTEYELAELGDVSYRYDSPVLAIHLDTMEDKKDWAEIDMGYIGHTKAEVLDKLKTYIDVLQELYNKESSKEV